MAVFGLSLVDGRGQVGGDADEFKLALHPDDRHLVKEFYELADKQDWYPVQYRIRRPDGTIRWLSGGGQVVARNPHGKARRLVNVVADVTDRKVAEEHVKFLMGEITHRSKNLLSVVQAIASQTGRTLSPFYNPRPRSLLRLYKIAHTDPSVDKWNGFCVFLMVPNHESTVTVTAGHLAAGPTPSVRVSDFAQMRLLRRA
jgi:hypothetical protein